MQEDFIRFPSEEAEWIRISEEFYNQWQFRNCIGYIDVKQFEIVCPAHSGSLFFSYKKRFILGLMAASDANKRFYWGNVGSYG